MCHRVVTGGDMRERDWNRRDRKRRARYTAVPDAVRKQHSRVYDGEGCAFVPTDDARARARNREFKNFGELENRAERRRLAFKEAANTE